MYEPPGTQYIQCDQVQAGWWLQLFNFCLFSHQPLLVGWVTTFRNSDWPPSSLFQPCLYFNWLIYKSWDLGRTPSWLGGKQWRRTQYFLKNKRQNYSQLYIELWPQFTKWFWKVWTFPLRVTLGLFTGVSTNLSFSPGGRQQRRLEDHQRAELQRQRQPERDEGDLLRLQQSVQQCDPGDKSPHNSQ